MDEINLIRLKKNIYEDVMELLANYGIKDERLNQGIAEDIAEAYLDKKERRR